MYIRIIVNLIAANRQKKAGFLLSGNLAAGGEGRGNRRIRRGRIQSPAMAI
jgi:hypothetical protein